MFILGSLKDATMSLLFELKNEFGGFVDYEWFTAKMKKCSRRPRDGHLVIEVHFPGDIGDTTVDLMLGQRTSLRRWLGACFREQGRWYGEGGKGSCKTIGISSTVGLRRRCRPTGQAAKSPARKRRGARLVFFKSRVYLSNVNWLFVQNKYSSSNRDCDPLLPKAPPYLIVGHVARINNPHLLVHFAIAPTLATYFAPGGVLVHAPTFGVLAAR